jgi:hypothetical protein
MIGHGFPNIGAGSPDAVPQRRYAQRLGALKMAGHPARRETLNSSALP